MTRYATAALSEELRSLRDSEGLINPREAVAWARKHPHSTLYQYLEWDDKTAAEEHRIQQVRRLIAVYIVDDNDNRRFVSLSIDRSQGGGYREVDEVIKQPDLREVMLNDAIVDLRRLKAKYANLKELVRVWAEAEAVEKQQQKPPPKKKKPPHPKTTASQKSPKKGGKKRPPRGRGDDAPPPPA